MVVVGLRWTWDDGDFEHNNSARCSSGIDGRLCNCDGECSSVEDG